jgi:hypothetical protein
LVISEGDGAEGERVTGVGAAYVEVALGVYGEGVSLILEGAAGFLGPADLSVGVIGHYEDITFATRLEGLASKGNRGAGKIACYIDMAAGIRSYGRGFLAVGAAHAAYPEKLTGRAIHGYEEVIAALKGASLMVKGKRGTPEGSYGDEVAVWGEGDAIRQFVIGAAGAFSPEGLAVGIKLGYKQVSSADPGERSGADREAGAIEEACNSDVVGGAYGDSLTAVVVRAAESLSPKDLALGRKFNQEDVFSSGA